MPNVLDKTTINLNNLTEKLFDLMVSEKSSEEDIQLILGSSVEFSKKESLKDMAVDFKKRITMNSGDIERVSLSVFDVAAYRESPEIIELLMDYVEQDKELSEADKLENFSSALCLMIGDKKLKSFNKLMMYKYYNINSSLQNWLWEGHDNPLIIAICSAESMTYIYSLLLHNASPTCEFKNHTTNLMESALSFSKTLPETNELKKGIIQALECAEQLELARKAYFNKDMANMFAAFAKAVSINNSFVHHYIKNMAYCAIDQLKEPRDKTDYRFLLGFISVFASILKMDEKLFDSYKQYGDFLLDTMQPILGLYDCEVKVPASIHKLFNGKDEKTKFFNTAVVPALVEGSSVQKTYSVMQGKKDSRTPSIVTLVKSMSRGGIISRSGSAINKNKIETKVGTNIKPAWKY